MILGRPRSEAEGQNNLNFHVDLKRNWNKGSGDLQPESAKRTISVCEMKAHRNPMNLQGLGAMEVTKPKPFKSIWFGNILGPTPY